MLGLLGLSITLAAVILGYMNSRRFVRTRLRYVDAAQRWTAPLLAGLGAAVLATPVAWLLPLVGGGTALLFGVAVGTGVAHGARDGTRGTALIEP
jgi:O-antigen/teichoic acid export membrane protein